MMRYLILTLIAIICFTDVMHSQKLVQFTDSIIQNVNRNNYEKATYFNQLAEKEIINKSLKKKDTLFADYLYAKGVLNVKLENFNAINFEESIAIWDKSTRKNYLKIIKNYYFLASGYLENKEFDKAYIYYQKLYSINKENGLGNNLYYSNSVYTLSYIEYKKNFNLDNAERYADEYIDINREKAILNFDFNYAYAHRWREDLLGYENVLKLFKKKYVQINLNNPQLYLQINYLLYKHYYRQNYYYQDNKDNTFKNIILNGEECIKIINEVFNGSEYEKLLQEIYSSLFVSYSNIDDHNNALKYKKLIDK